MSQQASFSSTLSLRHQQATPTTTPSLSEEGEEGMEVPPSKDTHEAHINPPDAEPEDLDNRFEDVGLDDEKVKPKKRGLFARFGDSSASSEARPSSSGLGISSHGHSFLGMGRKRGASGQGSELGHMQIAGEGAPEVKVDH